MKLRWAQRLVSWVEYLHRHQGSLAAIVLSRWGIRGFGSSGGFWVGLGKRGQWMQMRLELGLVGVFSTVGNIRGWKPHLFGM